MPLREYEFYHGAALSRLLSITGELRLVRLSEVGAGCYAINDRIGALIKYATDRLTPWSFTFHADHKQAIRALGATFPDVMILLVCRDDGIVALDQSATLSLIGDDFVSATISVLRKPRQMYLVSGPLATLPRKLADCEYARELLVNSERSL
jgi:hypothetical protein